MAITHCICANISFAEIKKIAEERKETDLFALKEQVCFGANCRMCLPYIRRMLLTGETRFDTILEK
ncbi:MAG TPA: (2Fe-2S)-binding protein [candidate division Zixibacteria bacterium]|nr:(2Fe-2S)-binding protein [candidate division Zixibacteria bacterium]